MSCFRKVVIRLCFMKQPHKKRLVVLTNREEVSMASFEAHYLPKLAMNMTKGNVRTSLFRTFPRFHLKMDKRFQQSSLLFENEKFVVL